jgi:uncharacterized protein YjbI with pentapeptide repeats
VAASSGTREPWQPLRWPTDPSAVETFREWLADPSEVLYALDLDLRGADLSGGPFTESWFSRSNLADAVLRGTEFYRAHCEESRFIRANLVDADFVRAELREASFVRASAIGANLTKASGTNARFTETDLRRANLTDASFVGADFTRADLSGAVVDKTSLRNAVLTDAKVVGLTGTILGPVAVLPSLSLDGSELEQWLGARGAAVSVLRTATT